MFNKIIGKRSNRKPSKVESNETAVPAAGGMPSSTLGSGAGALPSNSRNPGMVSGVGPLGSKVAVNHVPRNSLSIAVMAPPVPTQTVTAKERASTNCVSQSATGVINTIENLPTFRDVPAAERQNLLVRKLNLCCHLFDFSDPAKFIREKEIKRQNLLELVDYIQSGSGKVTEAVQEDLGKMLSANIFRSLPPASHENTGSESLDPDEEELCMEPAWPHLQLVYELLLRYVVSTDTDPKIAKRCIDHYFVLRLLDLFDSEDLRERGYLETILLKAVEAIVTVVRMLFRRSCTVCEVECVEDITFTICCERFGVRNH